jgi:hypothetical protein
VRKILNCNTLEFSSSFHKLFQDLLKTLPQMFTKSGDPGALGPALQAAFDLMAPTGG